MRLKLFLQPVSLLLIVFLVYLTAYVSHSWYLKKTVYGDGIFYFSWVRSVIIDHDIDFRDEFITYNVPDAFIINELPKNKYGIGPAILWSAPFLWTHALVRENGYTFPYQFVTGLATVLYVITGLILLYRLLCTITKPMIASITVILIAVASNLFFYGAIDTVNSHGVSFFAVVLFLTFLFQKQAFATGAALALIALIRPQDAVYGILILPFLSKKNVLPISLSFLVCFLPQFFVWYMFTGNPLISPYFTAGEHYTFLRPHLFAVLFSLKNGLFIYTPLVVIALIGYFLKWKKTDAFKILSIIVLVFSWYLVSSWSSWDQGASFSGRMFVGLLPLLAIPLAQLMTYLSKKVYDLKLFFMIFVLPLGGINLLLIFYFLLTHG